MIAGVVLAAGRSSRLGRPKQLLAINGEPLLRYTVRRILTSALDEIFVVVGHEAEAVGAAVADLPVSVVVNPDYALGQSTSVRAGLAVLPQETEAAIFLLGDQPEVNADTIDALIAAWRSSGASVTAPSYGNTIGNPILFAKSAFPQFTVLTGDTGARAIVETHRQTGDLLTVPIDSLPPRDIDTESDYEALLASLQQRV